MRQRQTKRTKQVAVSDLDQALSALEEAQELLKTTKKQVRKELTKKSTTKFTKVLEETLEQRARMEVRFKQLDYKKCKIYSRNSTRLFRLRFEDDKDDMTSLYYSYNTNNYLVSYFCPSYPDDPNSAFLLEYFKMLLRAFLTQQHHKLSKYLDDLVSLEDILSEINTIQ